MLEYEELMSRLQQLKSGIDQLSESLELDRLNSQLEQLEGETMRQEFWNDPADSQKVLQQMKKIKEKITQYKELVQKYDDIHTLIELADSEGDISYVDEIRSDIDSLAAKLEGFTLATLLTGEYDSNNAILTFQAGAGGTEAQDWAEMLYRMYTRWAERHGFKYKILDYLDGEEAGIKSASVLIEGNNAYGFLKSESGIHRLVRISPFDSSGRRHTSFAAVDVLPEVDDTIEVEIKDDDLRIDTYRSGGAGGQHVNKTDSAVRITHIPTGIVVACQNERSQHQNKEVALKMLKSKLIEIKEREHLEKIDDIKGEHKDIAWGSQIRSYVFMPYTLVKDHRTGYESGNITSVMDGEIDGFINAYLRSRKSDS